MSGKTEKIVGVYFDFPENFKYWKNCGQDEGYHVFPLELSSSTVSKRIAGNPSTFQKVWAIQKTLCILEGYHDFPSKLFSLTVPKKILGEPFDFSESF